MNNNVKSATVAGLLGIFLGSVGAHDWYLGDKKKGIIHVCLAASGFVVTIIASVILPATLSFRAMLAMAGLVALLDGIAALIMGANALWGLIEGIQILVQGDAGLARKGYAIAQSNANYGNYNNQPMNNFGAQQNTNNTANMNNVNSGQMNENGNNMNGMNGGDQNGQ